MSKFIVPLPIENYFQSLKIVNRVSCAEIPFDRCYLTIWQLKEILNHCNEWVLSVRNEFNDNPYKIELFNLCIDHKPLFVDFDFSLINNSQISSLIDYIRLKHISLMYSYHNFQLTPSFVDLVSMVRMMFSKGSDIVKIACKANIFEDVETILKLYDVFENIVALSLGDLGRISRIMALEKGMKISYVAYDQQTINAPGQYTLEQMHKLMKNNYKILYPVAIKGEINAPISKSWFQRGLFLSMLSSKATYLCGVDNSEDSLTVKQIIKNLGSEIVDQPNALFVEPACRNLNTPIEINVGQSGLALRVMAFVSTLFDRPITLKGEGTLLKRPLGILTSALDAAGILWHSNNFNLPITIIGKIKKDKIRINASASSQPLSGLLIVLPLLDRDVEVIVTNLTSRPYIDLTLELIKLFGAYVENHNYEKFNVYGNQKYIGGRIIMEADWSGASNFLVGAALTGEVFVKGLKQKSYQADIAIIQALNKFGAHLEFYNDGVYVCKNNANSFVFDATHSPDLVPILTVLACGAKGKSVINGVNRLIHKESNRIDSVLTMIKSLGGKIHHRENSLIIEGEGFLEGGFVNGFSDHRIVMAAALASTISKNSITLTDVDAVKKSYPKFFNDLSKLAN